MNIFIGENNLKDYLALKIIIEKWSKRNQQKVHFYWYKELYYQLPKCLKICDIVFLELDISINGFEFSKILRKNDARIPIVFQTRNIHYGIASYQVKATHYLLKPVNDQEIYKILDQIYLQQCQKNIIYQLKKQIQKIPFEEIIYIEAYQHHIMIHQKHTSKRNPMSLKEISFKLDSSFYRCHRSYIVNLKHIDHIEGMNCIMINQQVIPISKNCINEFTKKVLGQI